MCLQQNLWYERLDTWCQCRLSRNSIQIRRWWYRKNSEIHFFLLNRERLIFLFFCWSHDHNIWNTLFSWCNRIFTLLSNALAFSWSTNFQCAAQAKCEIVNYFDDTQHGYAHEQTFSIQTISSQNSLYRNLNANLELNFT